MNKPNVLVIGGSGALGSEVCRTLSRKGFNVAFTWCTQEKAAGELAVEIGGTAHYLDLRDITHTGHIIKQVAQQSSSLDGFIVTSGIATATTIDGIATVEKFLDLTPEAYDEMMSVNVRGTFFACQEAGRIMAEQKSGRIVITSSIDGIKPLPAPVDYACCKAALWGLTQSLSKELGKYNILVNMLAPGILEGGMAKLLSDDLLDAYKKYCTLGRVGCFSEVAKMVAYLASAENSYLTGQAIVMDGGL